MSFKNQGCKWEAYQTKGYGISVLIIYEGHWIGLCVGVKKKCYGQWNCLIWWFELFFLVILSDFGVQYVIGLGRLGDLKRTNGNGWRDHYLQCSAE